MGTKSLEVGPATLAVLSVTNRLIEDSGLSRVQIEARAEVSHNRLAVILRGERPITVDELIRICEAIGVSVSAVIREAVDNLGAATVAPEVTVTSLDSRRCADPPGQPAPPAVGTYAAREVMAEDAAGEESPV